MNRATRSTDQLLVRQAITSVLLNDKGEMQ